MHISNFRPLKRLGDVVRIFERVQRRIDARLMLVGDGPEYSRTQALVEQLGLVALEARASGVPVVASRVGGLPEVVEHGVTRYLAPVGDVEAMAEFSLKILSDCEMRKRFGEAARQRAVRLFDWHAVVPRYEEIYQRVIGDAR